MQQSRLRSLLIEKVGRQLHEDEILENTYDAADIHAKAVELFAYARDEEGMRRKPSYAQIRSALFSIGIHEGDDHPLMQHIEREEALDSMAKDDQ